MPSTAQKAVCSLWYKPWTGRLFCYAPISALQSVADEQSRNCWFSIFWQIPFPLAIILFRLSLLQGGEYLTFEEIILLLTLMGSCIYATISLTLKFVEFLLKNKKDRWLSAMSAAIIIVPQILRQLLKTATQNKLCGCLWCTIGDSNPGPTD